ncbi:Glycine betaine transporter OpuD [Staphylococcus aureus]|uniref:Glycine betaine transporter OpuD n=1 Tax=Staphylococcus aureus TaxID=1280 RepID=A0A380DY12_STAAU|nr:Glycine betaine transporter OpuD [Staphylococcus aureus]
MLPIILKCGLQKVRLVLSYSYYDYRVLLYIPYFSPIGKLKLGKPNDKPEFNTISWFAMLFSAGMGIGLVFYGAAEPMAHFATPPTADPKTT